MDESVEEGERVNLPLAAAVDRLPAGWAGHYFEAVESTQDEARSAARSNAPSRSIFVADYQRAGRGRQGRAWLAPPGHALLCSIVFREAGPAGVPWRWTNLASVSLVEAIQQLAAASRPAIKWPNDILLDDRKVAGVLAESSWDGRQELVAIVGVGVNVSTPATALAGVGGSATSLQEACACQVERGQLLLAFARRVDHWLAQPVAELFAAWQEHVWGRGQRLRLLDLGREEEVVVLGVDADGFLRVRLTDGTERRTVTGELIV